MYLIILVFVLASSFVQAADTPSRHLLNSFANLGLETPARRTVIVPLNQGGFVRWGRPRQSLVGVALFQNRENNSSRSSFSLNQSQGMPELTLSNSSIPINRKRTRHSLPEPLTFPTPLVTIESMESYNGYRTPPRAQSPVVATNLLPLKRRRVSFSEDSSSDDGFKYVPTNRPPTPVPWKSVNEEEEDEY